MVSLTISAISFINLFKISMSIPKFEEPAIASPLNFNNTLGHMEIK